jgi:hypothetical protein
MLTCTTTRGTFWYVLDVCRQMRLLDNSLHTFCVQWKVTPCACPLLRHAPFYHRWQLNSLKRLLENEGARVSKSLAAGNNAAAGDATSRAMRLAANAFNFLREVRRSTTSSHKAHHTASGTLPPARLCIIARCIACRLTPLPTPRTSLVGT